MYPLDVPHSRELVGGARKPCDVIEIPRMSTSDARVMQRNRFPQVRNQNHVCFEILSYYLIAYTN